MNRLYSYLKPISLFFLTIYSFLKFALQDYSENIFLGILVFILFSSLVVGSFIWFIKIAKSFGDNKTSYIAKLIPVSLILLGFLNFLGLILMSISFGSLTILELVSTIGLSISVIIAVRMIIKA